MTARQKHHGLNQQVLEQKRMVRKRERTWKQYKQQHQWKALSDEKKKFKSILRKARCEVISCKVA